jgi:acetyltransferase-like isoleucine patch superfamily enzyme
MISQFAIINKNVLIAPNCSINHFVILGEGTSQEELQLGENAIIRSHTVIYYGNKIGSNFVTGHHVLIREENLIGNNVSIGSNTVVEHHVKIGNNVRIHSNAFIPEFTEIEDDAWIGPNVIITNAKYPRSPNVKKELKGAYIRKGAKIGANCTILPGLEIGENSLIGAGSVVTINVPPNKVVVGNPAKIIKDISNLPY